ncbi:MAG: helix-turn-helix transcriptional regulator [Porticoccaceae bacterium]|nr:helix-turn-helix transcriptional regulator [Porticoccaceae bacterium]
MNIGMTPGDRLTRARKLNKLGTRTKLSKLISADGCVLSAHKIGRLERDEASPSVDEINMICSALNMSADWWLRDNTASTDAIARRVEELTQTERNLLMLILDFAK